MKMKILLIDDIKEFCALVKIFLSSHYEVIIARDGLEALSLLESGLKPDVIVTDLMMPRLDGYQLISKLKNNEPFKKIPVIVLSNIDKKQDRDELKRKGIYGYLNKPFSPDELRDNLTQMLNNALVYCN